MTGPDPAEAAVPIRGMGTTASTSVLPHTDGGDRSLRDRGP